MEQRRTQGERNLGHQAKFCTEGIVDTAERLGRGQNVTHPEDCLVALEGREFRDVMESEA